MNEIFADVTAAIEDGLYSVINRPDIVVLNILAFIVLVFFVRTFLWKRVTEFLDARQAALNAELDQAQDERMRAQSLESKSRKEYEHMKEETRQLKEKLTLEAYQQQEQLIINAKNEAKRRMDQTQKDIEFEIAQANDLVKQSIKEVAFIAAEKIVKREINEDIHQDIIDDILKERDK